MRWKKTIDEKTETSTEIAQEKWNYTKKTP
jgi:hypothetical protein